MRLQVGSGRGRIKLLAWLRRRAFINLQNILNSNIISDLKRNAGLCHMLKIATFCIDDCLFGVDASHLIDLLHMPPLKSIPQKKPLCFKQVAYLPDGRLIHIINSLEFFGLEHQEPNESSRLLCFKSGDVHIGLIVDGTGKMLEIDEAAIMPHLPITKLNNALLRGIITDDKEIYVILDIVKILRELGADL